MFICDSFEWKFSAAQKYLLAFAKNFQVCRKESILVQLLVIILLKQNPGSDLEELLRIPKKFDSFPQIPS